MSYNPPNPNGQNTSANSQPSVLASDQSAIPTYISNNLGVANSIRSDSQLRIATDSIAQFYDSFDSSVLDTTNRWTSGGTLSPIISGGIITISPSTTALNVCSLQSKPSFGLLGNMFTHAFSVSILDSGLKTGNLRFIGIGVSQVSPTVSSPIINGVGFEWRDTDGILYGVVWNNGIRIQSISLSTLQPTDGASHRYAIYYKTSNLYFEIDNINVGSINTPSSNISTLPFLVLSVNGASTISTATTFTHSFLGVGDTAGNGRMISDASFPWRKTQVSASGALLTSNIGIPTTLGKFAATGSTSMTLSVDDSQDLIVIGQSNQTAIVNNILTTTAGINGTDISGYRSCYIQINSTATAGTYIFEISNDNINFIAQPVMVLSLLNGQLSNTSITASAVNNMYTFSPMGRYVRVRIITTLTGGVIQSISRFCQNSFSPHVYSIAQNNATNLAINASQWGGTTVVNAGVAGTVSIGGNIPVGIAPTLNPIPLATDLAGLTRRMVLSESGGVSGPGEIVSPVNAFTAGSTTASEGTNSKTFQSFLSKDCDVYFGVIAQGNAANTIQIEGSYDNQIFSVIPMSRIDNLAAYSAGVSGNYSLLSTWIPVTGAIYKGRSYGYNFIRVHQTAFTTTGTNGIIRIVPVQDNNDISVSSSFTFDAQNTTEAVGTVNGVLQSGGIRTLNTRGATRGQLFIDAFTYATAAPTSSSIIVEGSTDNTTFIALPLQPRGGGVTVTAISTTPPAIGQWLGGQYEFDTSNYNFIRARWSTFVVGTATLSKYHGALKLINNGTPAIPQRKRTYSIAFTVIPAATATDIFQLIGSNTTTVEILKILISGTQTTGAMNNVILSKRLTVNTGGTSTSAILVPNSASDTAATAVGTIYTVNPTSTGTVIGDLEIISVPFSSSSSTANNIVERRYGINSKPITLTSASQAIALRLNGATLTGGSINICLEIAEY